MKKFYLSILALISFLAINAQVTVTPPAPLTITDCSFPTAYSPLGDIAISESTIGDISGTGDFILTAPANFEFQPGTGTVTGSSSDLAIGAVTITATTITFTINVTNTAILDVITISGIQVRGINAASGPSNIMRTASGSPDAIIASDAAGGGVNHGTLTSALYPSLVAGSVATSQTICYNTVPAAFTSTALPTGGTGSYTYQWQSSPDNITFTDIGGATATTYAPLGALTATTYYRRNETSGTCGTVSSNVIKITVDGNLVAGTVAASQTICYNTIPAAFTNTSLPTGGTGSYTYQWQSSPDNSAWTDIGGAIAATYAPPGALTATTYYRRNETSGTCGTVSSNVIKITVDGNLVAGTVAASQTICYNTIPAAFTSTTLPTGGTGSYTYQWQSSPDNITFTDIVGATATTYSPGVLTATTYYRRNETSGTCGTVSSNVIKITVDGNLVAGTVAASQTICYNTIPAVFTSITLPSGGSGTYTYQWQSSPDNSTWTDIGGAIATTYAPGALTATTYYKRNETSGASCGTVSSNVITITVNPNPTVNAITNQAVCNGSATTAIAFTGSVPGTIYNWTNNTPTIGLAASGTGNIASFITTNGGTTPLTATITVTPSYTNGVTCNGTATTFTITVNPTASVNFISNQTVCNNAATTAVTFGSPTSGGTIVYNWTNNTPSIGLAASGTGNIASFTATNVGTAPVTATIIVTPAYTNGVTCTGTARTFTITVNPTATITPVADQTVCNNTATTAVTFGSPTTGGSIVYSWTNSAPSIGLAASGSGNIASFTAINGGTAPVTATITVTPAYTNGTTCTGTPITFNITVNPTATVTAVANQSICNGAATNAVNFASPTTGGSIIYNWTNNTPSIGLAASGTGNIASFTATNGGTTPVTATITVTPSYTNGTTCTGTATTFTISVNPTATVTSVANQTVCNNAATTAVTFSSPTTGGTIVYNWTNNTPSIGLVASGTGNIASFTATNAGTAPVTATITITPSYTNGATCTGTATTFTITVNPRATVTAVSNQTLCNGATTTAVPFSSPTTGGTIVYNWTNNTPSIGLGASGSGTIPAFTAINVGAVPVTATITVTPTYTNGVTCTGTPITFTITVNPTATITTPSNQTVCNGAATTAVNFSGPVTWTNNAPSIGLAASGVGNIASFTAVNAGTTVVTATISATPTANGCTGNPVPFTITVNPTATVNPILNQTVCNGASSPATPLSGPVAGTTFTWTNNTPSIGLAASGSGSNVPAFTAVNGSGAPVIATITITPTANSCVGTSLSFTITVNPTPLANNPGNQTVCAGAATAAINFTGSVAGATYNWTNSNTTIGLAAASGTGNIASFTALNATSTAVSTTIIVTPTANGCPGSPVSFTITVNPKATINPIIDSACNGTPFSVTPVDGTDGVIPAGTTYTWPAPTMPGGLTGGVAGSGSSITGTLTNSTVFGGLSAVYTVTPISGSCTGTPFTVTVTVFPYPPKQLIDFFQTNVKSQQLCIGAQVGGGGQNDLDIEYQNGLGLPAGVQNGQPSNLVFDNAGLDWDWQYATGNPVGPTVPFVSSPGTTTTHYQHVLPPVPSIFSPIGDYWFRFTLSNNGCTISSDTIHLQVTSTLITTAGGPYVRCLGAGAFALAGSSVNGTSNSAITGQWSVFTAGSGTLSNTLAIPAGTPAGNANLSAVTFTPTAGFTGTAKLVLKSNNPGGGCQPAADTAYVIVLPLGNLQGCTAPANWTLVTNGGNGTTDQSQVPCAEALIGSDNGSGLPLATDYKICSGAGNFSFNWVFTAPSAAGALPVWHTADQTVNAGAGTNRGNFVANRPANLAVGDLIVVILHARDNVGSVAAPDGFSSIRKDVGGNSGNTNRGAIYSYWKVATASEPATYSFQANSMATNDDWVAVAGRVTGADPNNPIDITNGTNSNTSSVTTIIDPAITTLGANRLVIASLSIGDDDHGLSIAAPGGMTTILSGNSGLGKQITYGDYFQNFPAAGSTGTKTFGPWSNADPAAAQIFAIKPVDIPDDSAWVIVNGVQTLISGTSGTQGTFSIPVNSNDVIGYRITTSGNNGGPGRLTFYNVNIPNDTPKVTGTASITIPGCNPTNPTIAAAFITPTVTDNCGGTPTLVAGYPQPGSVVATGCSNSQTKTWLYVDNCGLQSKPFVQTVTWTTDNVKPVLTCPPANLSFCTVAGNNYSVPVVTATDNCVGGIIYSFSITGATTRSGAINDASGLFNPGVSTITWTATDGCGNFANCTTTVTIASPPTATISGGATICNGASTTISVTLTGTAPWSITYTNGGAPVTVNGILTSPYTFSTGPLASNTTYSLTAVSDSRCSGTYSGSASITVRPVPTAVISGTTAICSGGSATISIAPTGTAPWSVTYTDGVTPVTVNGIATSPYQFTVSPANTTTYTITAFSDANCSGTFSGSAIITVNPKPTILVSPSSPGICSGGSTSLTASGASTYSWSPATGLSATTGATVTAGPAVTTTYTVTGTDGNGCVNSTTVTVTVNTPPVTTGVAICQGGSGVISSSTVCANGTFTSGPNNAGTGANFDAGNTYDWVNPNNITTPGSPYATNTIGSGSLSNYLLATNYGFAIPAAATILGIKVDISGAISDPSGNVQVSDLFLVKDISIPDIYSGTASGVDWPLNSAFQVETYGSSADLWAGSWTPAEINNPNFGFIFDLVNNGGSNANALVDYVKVSVTYSVPGSLNWYTVSSGGSSIGSGSPFNPVGVLGSGLPDTNTPGTYPFYAECTTAPGCRTVTNFVINPLPTITPAPGATDVCLSSSAQNTPLTYSATNAPKTYSITWNAAATAAGFTPVTNAALPASPITIVVPANAPVNTYTGTITVKNANGCASSTGVNFTVAVDPVTVGGNLPSVSVCASGTGTLTLTGNIGNVVHWESSTDGGTTWSIIVNNTTTLTYSASPVTTLYRALVQSGSCSSAYSTISTVGVHNVWTGTMSVDWNNGSNWSDGVVPTTSCPDVFIPGGTTFEPILSGAPTATIINLHILAGGFLTVNGTGLLQIGGAISNAGVFDASNGTVEFNSTIAAQTIAANTFMNNAIHNLVISNTNAGGVSLAGPLNVFGSLTFGAGGTQFISNDNLTLKSTVTETASLGDMTGHTISGNVTVERYIATGNTGFPNHGKSWQMLATPTVGQNINQSWMEGATASNIGLPAGSNPHPGFGTMVTSDVAGAGTWPTPGFDVYTSPGPSIKAYDYVTTGFIGPANMQAPIYNQKGWYLFVRGDRSVFTSAGAATPTVLRTKGQLFTPANPPPVTNVVAGKFESIGNPYASAIDKKVIRAQELGGVNEFFYVWDPRLGGAYGYGAYQTFSLSGGNYIATPGGGSYGPFPTVNNVIQSGQAFLVQATGSNGTVSFTEGTKVSGSALVTSPNPVQQTQSMLRITLNSFNSDGSTSLLDGVLIDYSDAYSNAVDGYDARKSLNTGENLSIKVGSTLLAIERAQIVTPQDTIFLNLTGELVQQYQFNFDATNVSTDVQAFLLDSYLGTRTPLSLTGSTNVGFSVTNIAGSKASNRFMIVFEPLKALPVTITNLKAYLQDSYVNVEWKVENERNMKQYEVEKSTDGISFTTIDLKKATDNNSGSAEYASADATPADGYNYYRIRMVDVNGKIGYTGIVKVLVPALRPDIVINPNPITDGIIHLQLVNQPVGRYGIRLLNKLGQLIIQKQINHAAGSSTELIKWDYNLAHGIYQLEVTRPDGSIKDLNVMY